ncbi:MAG: hypothetical protein NZ888_06430 [Candidatus Nitrosocaldus sp.]|nr:hypothetical protein [Candidatus Nitrosocaldus sp.]MDW8000480.1 hypothetical protein [Candidatus Nitrosocaldus sp.]
MNARDGSIMDVVEATNGKSMEGYWHDGYDYGYGHGYGHDHGHGYKHEWKR